MAALAALAGSPLLAGRAAAQQGGTASLPAPLQLTVTGFSPSFAEPGHTITITGKIRNATSAPVGDLAVTVSASSVPLVDRPSVESFAHGRSHPQEIQVTGAAPATKLQLDAGHSWVFRLRVPVSALGFSCFGVYPLSVQVNDSALQAASEPVPLPYWPSTSTPGGCAQRPKPFPVAWIWPLIDVPHQGVCSGLTDNQLASSLGQSGRLGYLLAVGRRYASSAALTWAVDPALLDNARAMSRPYDVGFLKGCSDGRLERASQNARRWLASLPKATAGRPLFVTPYADVDVAALARYRGSDGVVAALAAGYNVAHRMLGRSAPGANGQPGKQLAAIAWPPGGHTSNALLNVLRGQAGIKTVILTAPPSSSTYTPGAVTRLLAGIGKYVQVLLADHNLSTLLGSPLASSQQSGAIFKVSQLYLAQTAMIAAEAPASVRPILVAPPRRWDPPRRLASGLLADTVSAPWLHPATAGQMASMPPEHLYPNLRTNYSPGELSDPLLRRVAALQQQIALLRSIQVQPNPDLNRAVFGIESSAWRGRAGKHARWLLARTNRYVWSQLHHGLSIRGSSGKHSVLHVTFGGGSSSVPMAIKNNLNYKVKVRLHVQATNAQVTGPSQVITIPPNSYSQSVKIAVRTAKNGRGTIKLSLTTPDNRPLPSFPLTIVVHTTHLGIIALTVGSIMLALFVIASAWRAIRAGRPLRVGSGANAGADLDATATGPADEERDGHGAGAPAASPPDPADANHSGPASPLAHRNSPGGQEFDAEGLAQPGSTPEHVGSVDGNGAGLAPAGPPRADQEATTGRRKNGEHG